MSDCAARIVPAAPEHLADWGAMRFALWPWDTPALHAQQAARQYLSGDPDRTAFIATDRNGAVIGFAEGTLRRDYVEGCETSPVGFLEGIFVTDTARDRGTGRALANAVGDWAQSRGCSEYASNALLENAASHAFHAAIGFAETERVVYFRKSL